MRQMETDQSWHIAKGSGLSAQGDHGLLWPDQACVNGSRADGAGTIYYPVPSNSKVYVCTCTYTEYIHCSCDRLAKMPV